jgi:peptidoglycan/LPS O-acetylase OafA/YrhL
VGILAALLGSIVVSIGISALLHAYVEKPGMALGSRIAKRLTVTAPLPEAMKGV